ncbi:radical SAM protein [bacterium]|nr:radical SAM protein [candidate division CSSED10-310 bacterium]
MSHLLRDKFLNRLAKEHSQIRYGSDVSLKVVLAFPSTYNVAMSNLGFHLVFASFNSIEGVVCHRAFLPDTADLKATESISLRSLESFEVITDYDIVAFSLNYENDLPGVIQFLNLSRIPIHSEDRESHHPFVIAGGILTSLNPEPMSPFLDAMVLGEGEYVIPEIAKALKDTFGINRDRKDAKACLSAIPGIYIPSFYESFYDVSGNFSGLKYIGPRCEPPLKTRIVYDLNRISGSSVIHSEGHTLSQIHLVEISRGCPRKCLFCIIPQCYRHLRLKSVERILEESSKAMGEMRIGLLGAGAADHPNLNDICRSLLDNGYSFSLSSLHASEINPDLANLILKNNTRTVTLAVETGNAQLRRKIRKNLTNEQIFEAVTLLCRDPVKILKLYFMIGLPGETIEDIEAIPRLSKRLYHLLISKHRQKTRIPKLVLSVSCFVPKPHSPFERAPMLDEKQLQVRLKILESMLRKIPNLQWTHDIPKWAIIQGLIARGDRRIAQLIKKAGEGRSGWRSILKESSVNPGYYLFRKRPISEKLPWDHMKFLPDVQ